MSHSNETSSFLGGIVIGAAIGAAFGLLFAPKSGKESREELSDEIKRIKGELDKLTKEVSAKTKQAKVDLEAKLRKAEDQFKEEIESSLGT